MSDKVSGNKRESASYRSPVDSNDLKEITYAGKNYACRYQISNSEQWLCAYGRSRDFDEYRIFLFEGEKLAFSHKSSGIVDVDPSDNGTVAVHDRMNPTGQDGQVKVYNNTGQVIYSHEFSSNIADIALCNNDLYLVVITLKPDNHIYLFDLSDKEQIMRLEVDRLNRPYAYFDLVEEPKIRIHDANDDPMYTVDRNGKIVWESEAYEIDKPFFNRLLDRLNTYFRS